MQNFLHKAAKNSFCSLKSLGYYMKFFVPWMEKLWIYFLALKLAYKIQIEFSVGSKAEKQIEGKKIEVKRKCSRSRALEEKPDFLPSLIPLVDINFFYVTF